jgi:hypothetical protein
MYYNEALSIGRINVHEAKLQKLWSTPIANFKCKLLNINSIQNTIKKIAYNKKEHSDKKIETNISTQIKKKLYESNFSFLNLKSHNSLSKEDENNLNEISNWFKICISDYYKIYFENEKDLSEIRIKESWIHITNNNGYHGPHYHPNCSICGNFYIDIAESNVSTMNGVNCFYSPVSTELSIDGYNYFGNAETSNLENFNLTLFPPNILHNATPYNGKTDRIILAFNALYGSANIDYIA